MEEYLKLALVKKIYVKCVLGNNTSSLTYEVKCSQYNYIYIFNTHHTFKKKVEGNLSDVQLILRNRQKSDSFAHRFEQHFKYTT